jgi:hypothetical protein
LQIGLEVIAQPDGKTCGQKGPQDPVIAETLGVEIAQGVVIQKILEAFGGDDQGLGDRDAYPRVFCLQPPVFAQLRGQEGQAAGLAAHGTASGFEKTAFGVKLGGHEVGNHAALAFLAALAQTGNQVGLDGCRGGEITGFERPQAGGQKNFTAGHQPIGKMVVGGMVEDRLVRHRRQQLFQGLHVVGAGHLTPVRHSEDKLAETQIAGEKRADLGIQRRRILVDEGGRKRLGPLPVAFLIAQHQKGDLR